MLFTKINSLGVPPAGSGCYRFRFAAFPAGTAAPPFTSLTSAALRLPKTYQLSFIPLTAFFWQKPINAPRGLLAFFEPFHCRNSSHI